MHNVESTVDSPIHNAESTVDSPIHNPESTVESSIYNSGSTEESPLVTNTQCGIHCRVTDKQCRIHCRVNELIIYYSREELTAWGNRSDEICQKLYKLNPQVPLIFSLRQVTLLIILYWTGLLPFFNIKESLLEIIVPGIMLDSDELLDKPLNGRVRFFFWMMDKLLIRPSLIKHLEARGIQTYLWVLNREKDFDRAFKAGATGVMSDRIELLRNYLDNKRSSSTLEAKED
ncbi:Lysophospholipase D gdpd1 [Bulinus truncatus]|nr:Lysophospholipase D gdpd1 [Bulinus truncatus]